MAYFPVIILVFAIIFIIWTTAYKNINPFFALTLTALGVGLLMGIPYDLLFKYLKQGFGHTLEKVGLIIILGTVLGTILQKTGATYSMANYILFKFKEKYAPLGIAIIGYIIGFPIFCDSGFIVLSGLTHSIVKKTQWPMIVIATALGTSLYAIHCLVPPHPGITVAVEVLHADLGETMLLGSCLAVPAILIGLGYAIYKGRLVKDEYAFRKEDINDLDDQNLPSVRLSFLPVILPIFCIALGSFVKLFSNIFRLEGKLLSVFTFIAEPIIALGLGICASLFIVKKSNIVHLSLWIGKGVEQAGGVLAIIGAGGMFGEVLQQSGIGKELGIMLSGNSLGIFLPFILASFLKTAQGSSTVAIITASSLLAPLLGDLGLHSPFRLVLATLSLGAGSMCVSHSNDAYFWVVNSFSSLGTKSTLQVYSISTLLMGVVTQILIWGLFTMFG